MASVKRELQALMNRGKSAVNIEEPWWLPGQRTGKALSGLAGAITAGYEKAKMYKGNQLDDTYVALTNLLKVADSDEGMKLYEKKLSEFTSESQKFGGFDDNIVQAETLKQIGKQKNDMRRDFDMSIKATNEELFQSDDFLDTADEFVNIQDTMDARKIKGSVADFLQSELANANRLRDGMVGGFQIQGDEIVGTNFRYNKAEANDKETFRKLNLYRDRLDLAVKSLAGDKMISSEEAEAIIIGDPQHYTATKNAALRKAEFNYKANKGLVTQYDGLINTALQKQLSTDDMFKTEGLSEADKLKLGSDIVSGSWDAVVQKLRDKQAEYLELKNTANQNYKNWYGSEFEKVEGGMTQDDINKLTMPTEIKSKEDVKKAAEISLGITIPEKDVTAEQITSTKEARRRLKGVLPSKKPEDKELYSSSESILQKYIEGKIDADSLREIGGQSLVNKAGRIKDAYKGEYAGRKKYKGKPISDIDTLKELKYGVPGDRFSWHDIVSDIYSKKGKGIPIADNFLTGKHLVTAANLRWKTRRDRANDIKVKFQKLGISLEEFKKKYEKDYSTLVNLLSKSRNK